eukprot:CAMPEP_0177661870 /NCGR_PEP_ID=MMETSP0447-20121125/18949_1 /TAXON_ID=0 /ORGANISM="Stygamoeba regulata, Strain BSH-02190019" /LENGTH=437 /DNA_ID=CAMNT_0019167321 /DNA_START=30 /DNA_END=1343 /DNA_ORIENTATION=-
MKVFALFVVFAVMAVLAIEVVSASSVTHVPLTRRDRRAELRREHMKLRGEEGKSTVIPLRGNESRLGEYYMDFWLGNPRQHFTAQVDTGSSDLAIPRVGCGSCGSHPDAYYNPSKSSMSQSVGCSNSQHLTCPVCNHTQCAYEIRYGDGSGFDADVTVDALTISGLRPVTQAFGAITSEENPGGGEFEPFPTDGIIGFAYQALSECKAPTPMDNLAASGQVADIFSMCMTNDGGSMALGGSGNWSHGEMQWTPIQKKLWYVVNVEGVSVGGESLGLGHFAYNGLSGAIVDSGTTFLITSQAVWSAMEAKMKSHCQTTNLVGTCGATSPLWNGRCIKMTDAQAAAYPDIEIQLSGSVTLTVPSALYLQKGLCGSPVYWAFAMAPAGTQGLLMGDTVMKGYEVVFDRVNSRIGFGSVLDSNNNIQCPDGNQAPPSSPTF